MEGVLNEEPRSVSKAVQSGPIMNPYGQDVHEEYIIDDVYGRALDLEKAAKAGLEELRYFKNMGVYEKSQIR